MEYLIPQELRNETHCLYDFNCLAGGKCGQLPLCEIDYTSGQLITVLKSEVGSKVLKQCQYALEYCDDVICRCPVRYYLYKKHHVNS